MPTAPTRAWTCFHGVKGGCPYCKAIEPADDGPDPDYSFEPCHTGLAARTCGYCASDERY